MTRAFLGGLVSGSALSLGLAGGALLLTTGRPVPEAVARSPVTAPLSEISWVEITPLPAAASADIASAPSAGFMRSEAPVASVTPPAAMSEVLEATPPEVGFPTKDSLPAPGVGAGADAPQTLRAVSGETLPRTMSVLPVVPRPARPAEVVRTGLQEVAPTPVSTQIAMAVPTELPSASVTPVARATIPAKVEAPLKIPHTAPQAARVAAFAPVLSRVADTEMPVMRPASPVSIPAAEETPAPQLTLADRGRDMNATHKPVAEPATVTAVPARAPLPQNLPGRALDSAEILRPSIGRPATTLAERNVTAVEPARAVSTPGQAAVASAEAPLEAFAAAHDAASGLPLLSFVLVDTGQSDMRAGLGLDTLAGFPYPVTIAVDASLPDAADRARAYRAQGFEVMAVVDVPENLTAADTEVALSVALTKVPGAIGIFEGTRAGLQGNSDISNQIRDILSDTGHGIVWQPNGLDAAQKQAAQAGVASQTLSRDLVDADLSPGQMRRVLDRAVFRAGQEGAVIMAGKAEAATVAALRDWARERRAERIAVAPVSAVLRAGQVPREG